MAAAPVAKAKKTRMSNRTVSGQNSNNSVRVTDAFLKAVRDDADWALIRRTDGKVHKIEVRVSKPGLIARGRRTYQAPRA